MNVIIFVRKKEKQMKKAVKFITFVLVLTLSLSLIACGGKKSDETTAKPNETTKSQNETTAAPSTTKGADSTDASSPEATGSSPSEKNPDALSFTLNDDKKTYSVSGYNGTSESVIIPTDYKDLPVTKIDGGVFKDRTSLVSILIPASVTSVGENAFGGCSALSVVFYTGSTAEWSRIIIASNNTKLTGATRCYYSASEPTSKGNYWHYINGVPTIWTAEGGNNNDNIVELPEDVFD